MPRAPKKCGRLDCETRVTGRTYCPSHTKPSPSSLASGRNRSERERRAIAVAMWVKANGYVCPGWQRDPHPSRDLKDHWCVIGSEL
mgnify:CR=1 FL=1